MADHPRHRTGAVVLLTVLVLVLGSADGHAHAGHYVNVSVANHRFDPATVTLAEGDTVLWDFIGPDTNHTVTSDDGQAMSFDSDPDGTPNHRIGDGYAVTFNQPGTWTYHCRVHSGMRGTVEVQDIADVVVTAPEVSNLRVEPRGRRLRVRYRISEASGIRITIRRVSRTGRFGRVLREIDGPGPPGPNRRVIRLAGLSDGLYRLTVVAIDSSTGHPTAPQSKAFTLR